jgi:hypothetical protein
MLLTGLLLATPLFTKRLSVPEKLQKRLKTNQYICPPPPPSPRAPHLPATPTTHPPPIPSHPPPHPATPPTYPPAPPGAPGTGAIKVVVATNVAETSITIDDVTCVIDCGRVKEMRFDPDRGIARLQETWVSQVGARADMQLPGQLGG